MKETGIVRRIDELGRVVIPKELRKTMRIKEGDPLEIFTDAETLMLKKYSPVSAISDISDSVVDALYSQSEMTALVVDFDNVVAVKGKGAKELAGKRVSSKLVDAITERKTVFSGAGDGGAIPLTEDGINYKNQVIVPIISGGDALGAVIIGDDRDEPVDAVRIKMTMLAADLIARQS